MLTGDVESHFRRSEVVRFRAPYHRVAAIHPSLSAMCQHLKHLAAWWTRSHQTEPAPERRSANRGWRPTHGGTASVACGSDPTRSAWTRRTTAAPSDATRPVRCELRPRAASSTGQSSRLIICQVRVQVPGGPPQHDLFVSEPRRGAQAGATTATGRSRRAERLSVAGGRSRFDRVQHAMTDHRVIEGGA
jgi:hypothetical protein